MSKNDKHTRQNAKSSDNRPPLPYPVNDGRVSPGVRATRASRERRRRSRIAVGAGSALAIGGIAGMSFAMADPAATAVDEIAFSGGCGVLSVLSATSEPSVESLEVAPGTHVTYVNELETVGTLHVGQDQYDIEKGQSHTFTMNTSAEIAMIPECKGLFPDYAPAQVVVTEEAAVDEGEDQDGADEGTEQEDDKADLPDPSESGPEESDGSGEGSDGAADGQEGTEGSGEAPDESAAGATGGQDGSGDAGEPASADSEEKPDEDRSEGSPLTEGTPEQPYSFGEPADAEDQAVQEDFAKMSEEVAAVDPDSLADGASGLLAIVAIACLVGVSAAVMRIVLKTRGGTA
ncbi:ICP22 family protein [Salininema proteolyticum]|uniref:Uncharacterized protein n=1 Tax=Salininema proteolyticum TaxID=1607685 RepID=A0ABV8TTN9_9ACTN